MIRVPEANKFKFRPQHGRVLRAIERMEEMSASEVSATTGIRHHVARARCSELRDAGFLRVTRQDPGSGAFGNPKYFYQVARSWR